VLPQVAFVENEAEADRIGRRLAVEAIHSVADRPAWPRRLARSFDGSLIPMLLLRFETAEEAPGTLEAAEQVVSFPMQPFPTERELESIENAHRRAADDVVAGGGGDAELYGHLYHSKWAERTLRRMRSGPIATSVDGPVHAVRIGDGVIVTGPGEVFTEIGMAVKERSPGRPTLYAGYTNGAVGYFPTASAYTEGGYEPVIANRSYGTPAPMAPACERLLVETGVRLAESLFPDAVPFSGEAWTATGRLPALSRELMQRPADDVEYIGPVTAPYAGQRGAAGD
jgi:neutral ceramidase